MSILAYKPEREGRLATELEAYIRSGIRRGELKPGQRLGSAKQLAKYWKTSYGAVRQSLETLAAKGLVERRARAGTFVTSDTDAVGGQTDARNIIGLLVPDIRIPEYALITRYLQDAGQNAGIDILVSSTDNDRERYDQSVMRHLKAGVGGLVLVSPQQGRISLQTLVEIENSGVPIVNYARTVDVVPWPTVQTDVYQAAYLPIKHLCDLGRQRIAFMSYPTADSYQTQMQYGLYRAVADAGLSSGNITQFSLPDNFYLSSYSDSQSLFQILDTWFEENKNVDAICCMHDHIAATMLKVLAQRGVRVPEDVAVSGHGTMPDFFGIAPGELTSVDTRIDLAAIEMVRLLQSGSVDSESNQPTVIAIKPELVIGRSTVKDSQPAPPAQG